MTEVILNMTSVMTLITFANMTLVIRNMIHQNGGDIRGAISSSAGQFDI